MAVHQNDNRQSLLERDRAFRRQPPLLTSPTVTLRGLRSSDAQALLTHLGAPRVRQDITPPPSTFDEMKQFIRWTQSTRRQHTHLVFGVVPAGHTRPVGMAQLWKTERDFSVAEWGFALSEKYWGSDLFTATAQLILELAFGTLGVHRLEARVAEANIRGHAALSKIGATREACLRGSFKNGDRYDDHIMWAIVAGDRTVGRAEDQTD